MQRYEIHHGDNLEWLRSQPDNSIDSFVTDPPYGLGKEPDMVKCLQDWIDHGYHVPSAKKGFMGREWDAFVPQPIFWKEVFRVLKPGGHVVSFGGTRTYDLMVLAIRLAGFEIRDQLSWIYGGGFPKSANVSKMIDKQAGAVREVVGTVKKAHITQANTNEGWHRPSHLNEDGSFKTEMNITAPATDEAKGWDGWGTALSPSHEPIVLARKPLEKGLTVAQNVLKWGCGALNIDKSRIGVEGGTAKGTFPNEDSNGVYGNGLNGACEIVDIGKGRWPSNLLLANVPSVLGLFPETKGAGNIKEFVNKNLNYNASSYRLSNNKKPMVSGDVGGSNSRYFFRADLLPIEEEEELNLPIHAKAYYCSKPSKYERQLGKVTEGSHPTVKPVALMHHLVTLVTPPNGVCCDPFLGSGTTGIATMLAGPNIRFKGIEMTAEYIPIATDRIKNWKHYRQFVDAKKEDTPSRKLAGEPSIQQSLF